MTLLNKNSVLIIGAGVSAPFGVPMGGQMIDNIREGLVSDQRKFHAGNGVFQPSDGGRLHDVFSDAKNIWDIPYWSCALSRHYVRDVRKIDSSEVEKDVKVLQNVEKLLADQTSETIDDMVVENPSIGHMLKACIAVELTKSTYRMNNQLGKMVPNVNSQRWLSVKNKDSRSPSKQHRNWIHLLINLVRQGLRTGAFDDGHRLRIISFNYDGILEQVLAHQFQNTETDYADFSEYLEIVHPHGQCGQINRKPIESAKQLFDWSQQICVVNETQIKNAAAEEARKTAKRWIAESSKIYAVGFAFSGPNSRMLGMHNIDESQSKYLSYCNYDGSTGLKLAAERCSIFFKRSATEGTVEKPISVEHWFYSGILGEFSA